jgi:hypothetical protein
MGIEIKSGELQVVLAWTGTKENNSTWHARTRIDAKVQAGGIANLYRLQKNEGEAFCKLEEPNHKIK